MLGLSVLGSTIAYVIFFDLVRRLEASQVSVVTYISPATSVVLGALLLAEQVGLGTLLGLLLIAIGVALVNGTLTARRARRAAVAAPAHPAE